MSNEELVAEIQAGSVELMGQLWEQVERLVKWKAKRIMTVLEGCPGRGVEFEDLYQSGYLAMVAAVNTYDSAAGGAFSTWLMYHLQHAFAEATGYHTKKSRQEPLNNFISLDTPLTDDIDSDDLMDVIADPSGQNEMQSVEETLYQKQLHDSLESVLASISPQYSEVLRLKHYQGLTYTEVGENLGVSYERVRQIENRAIRELRKPKFADRLLPFYDFDFYGGTSLSTFRYSGMSVQERYISIQEERREREFRRDRKRQEGEIQNQVNAMMENIAREAAEKAANITPEEKERLLKLYGLA